MGMVIVFLVAVIAFAVLQPWKSQEEIRNELKEIEDRERVRKETESIKRCLKSDKLANYYHLKYCYQFIWNMEALDDYYKRGYDKLTPLEAKMYFSYPQTIVIDDNDDISINGIKMGKAKDHLLINNIISHGVAEKYRFIKEICKGKLIVESYNASDSFLYDWRITEDTYNQKMQHIKQMKSIELKRFKKYEYTLPKEYKDLANDLFNNEYTIDEMKEKYKELYKKCQDEYFSYIDKKEKQKILDDKEKSTKVVQNTYGSSSFRGWLDGEKEEERTYPSGLVERYYVDYAYLAGLTYCHFVDSKRLKGKYKEQEAELKAKYPEAFIEE